MKRTVFPLFFHVFLHLGIFSNAAQGSDQQICQQPQERPLKTRDHPGYYGVVIVFNSCNDEVYINNDQMKYEEVKDRLDSYLSHHVYDLDIHVGNYQPCQETHPDPKLLDEALEEVISKLAGDRKPQILRLYNLAKYNFELIQAVQDSVTLVFLRNCNQRVLSDGLKAVEGCENLNTLVIYGPAEFTAVWDALQGKPDLVQIHMEQESGVQDAEGLSELFKTLPKLESILLQCNEPCQTDYERLVDLAAESFRSMDLVSLKTDTQEIDTVGVEISKILGPKLHALYLRGSQAIHCENAAEIVTNLLRIPVSRPLTVYLTIEHYCPTMEELWNSVESKLDENETLRRCPYHLPHCRRVSGTAVTIQDFME